MATFVGDAVDVGGGIAATSLELNGLRWTINAVAEAVETTAGWDAATADRTYGDGWRSWSGTIEARADDTLALTTGMPGNELAACTFIYNATGVAGNLLTGAIVITGMDVTAERSGEVLVTWSFQGDGALTPT